jgi:hypothetical protein
LTTLQVHDIRGGDVVPVVERLDAQLGACPIKKLTPILNVGPNAFVML